MFRPTIRPVACPTIGKTLIAGRCKVDPAVQGKRMSKLITILTFACCVGGAWADTVTLKDGRVLEGDLLLRVMVGGATLQRVKLADGGTVSFAPEQVKSIVLNSALTPSQQAAAAWSALESLVRKSDDLSQLIDAHQKYLKDYPTSPKAPVVTENLANYEKMKADDYIRFRGNWMPRGKADVLMRQATAGAQMAREQLAAGHIKEAQEKAEDALQADGQNTLALTVAGVVKCRQNNLPAARDYFSRLLALDDGEVLARNNLGVISFDQNRQAEGLNHFAKAVQAAPGNRQILDNIVAALARYTGSKDIQAYKDLVIPYTQAEAKMAVEMAQKQLYRWSGTWVTKELREKFDAQLELAKGKLARLEDLYNQTSGTLTALDQELHDVNVAYDSALNDFNIAQNVLLNYQGGYYTGGWLVKRDLALNDMTRLATRRAALEPQRATLVTVLKQVRADGVKAKADLTKLQTSVNLGTMRLLEPGEVENPPPPAPL